MKLRLALLGTLALLASPARAQVAAGVVLINVPHLDTFLRYCWLDHYGLCPGVEGGIDWGAGKLGGLRLGTDIGYSVPLGAGRRTALNPRVGVSLLDNDVTHTAYIGVLAAMDLCHQVSALGGAGCVGYSWRRYPGFVWSELFVGLGTLH